MALRRATFALLAIVLGCPRAPPRRVDPTPPPDPRAQVRELVKAVYSVLERGSPDPLAPFIAPDVMAFGFAPSDTFAARDPMLSVLRHQLLPISLGSAVLRVRSGRIDVGIAADERSGWFWDLPRVELERAGTTTTWLPRITGHAVVREGAWVVDAVHVSLAVPDERIFAPDAARNYLPPADVLAERGKDSDALVGLARRLLDDVGVKVDRTSDRVEVVLLGTGPLEVFEGGKAFKDLVRPKLSEIKKSVFSYKVDGAIRSRLSPTGGSGWVAANVVLRLGAGKKQQVLPPFRVLWVFTEEGGLWNLASEHQSLALKEELRQPADAETVRQFTVLDGVRRARTDPKLVRAALDAGSPSDGRRDSKPALDAGAQRGGRVSAATDGGIGTFE